MNISVIIPNYNGENLLQANLPQVSAILKKYNEGNAEIIVVDDGSSDNSVEFLTKFKSEFNFFNFIALNKNSGYSTAVNAGVSQAKGEVVILLNTDVVPREDFLLPLLSYFKQPSVFAVACMDESIENGKIVLRGRGLGKWEKGILVHRRGEVNKNNTLWVSGGSGAFRKSIWDKLGGMNTIYNPFYWEDIDLSYRALKSGYEIYFESKSIVKHEHEKGIIKSKISKDKVEIIAYRNQFIFSLSNATDFSLKMTILIWIPYFFLSAIISRNWNFVKGLIRVIILIPKIIKTKSKFNSQFIKKDNEVIKLLND